MPMLMGESAESKTVRRRSGGFLGRGSYDKPHAADSTVAAPGSRCVILSQNVRL